jgi:hypothetical protein
MWRHRQRGQTLVIAVVAMISMLGALSMVIDAGVYFVIQRQLQNAADAAALAAVWYDPACNGTPLTDPTGDWRNAGCQPAPAPANGCPPVAPVADPLDVGPCLAAKSQVQANLNVALSLCAGPNRTQGSVNVYVHPANNVVSTPPIRPYVVTLSCDAPHWFAQVLPGVLPSMTIQTTSAAALGWLEQNGAVVGGARPVTNPPLAARLTQPN